MIIVVQSDLIQLIDCIQSIWGRPLITERFIRVRYLILKNLIDFSLIMSVSFELIKLLVLIILKLIELHLESLVVDGGMMVV